MIKIIVADDHPIVSNGLQSMIERDIQMKVVGLAENSTVLFGLLKEKECHVIVVDYSMPGDQKQTDGMEMLKQLRMKHADKALVLFTTMDNPGIIASLIKFGISTIVSKKDPLDYLHAAIISAVNGRSFISPSISQLFSVGSTGEDSGGIKLSKRELEVLRLCAQGLTLVSIARRLNRSDRTISSQKSIAMRKLGLRNDYELYQYAISTGLIEKK
ncbi:response regulator [Chromobacterium haemolyticum]|uniref:response regulator n=1 Tax=Chromobacterium TaxID=535 RepID=UPI004055DA29